MRLETKLFGGALTPTEQAEFERVIITPDMDPAQAAANLARQRDISRSGYQRLERAYGGEYNLPNMLPETDTLGDEWVIE